LDLSRIESGKIDLQIETLPLVPAIDDVLKTVRPVAVEKGLNLGLQVTDSAPAQVSTDPQRLGQILKNLLSNALKFTERGAVTVTVSSSEGFVDRHGHRHRGAPPTGHLRGVSASRRQHAPQVRRNGLGPQYLARFGPPPRGRDPRTERAWRGQYVHASAADRVQGSARGDAASARANRGCASATRVPTASAAQRR
jgi:hypothetical protein